MKDCIPWEGLLTGAEEQREEEGVAEMRCYELTTMAIPHPPTPPGKKGGGGKVVFVLFGFFYFSVSYAVIN